MLPLPSRTATAALFLLLAAAAAGAATVSLQADADAFVTNGPSSDLSDNNYGGAGSMAVAAAGLPKGEFQSVLRFDASAAKSAFDSAFGTGQWIVTGAQLQLTATPPVNAIFNATAAGLFNMEWMSDDSWGEGTGSPANPAAAGVNFTTLPAFLGTGVQSLNVSGVPFSFNGSTTGTTPYNLGLAAGFLGDIYAGTPASLHLAAADASVSALFNTRSVTAVASRPALILSAAAVPEPGRMILFAVGASLILARRRRS